MKLLLVEDSHRLQRSLGAGLRNSGFTVDQAFDGVEAREHIHMTQYDLIILDLMIPRLSGLELLGQLRRDGNPTYVLILSAMDQTHDRIRGLDLGADDYLVKPFSFDELVSRIRAVSRREHGAGQAASTRLSHGELIVDSATRTVIYAEVPVILTPSEYAVLDLLLRRRGQLFSQDQLIDRLYRSDQAVTRNAIEAHISSLRRKLRQAGASMLIRTRRGFGYFIE